MNGTAWQRWLHVRDDCERWDRLAAVKEQAERDGRTPGDAVDMLVLTLVEETREMVEGHIQQHRDVFRVAAGGMGLLGAFAGGLLHAVWRKYG